MAPSAWLVEYTDILRSPKSWGALGGQQRRGDVVQ